MTPYTPDPTFPEGEQARKGWIPTKKWLAAFVAAVAIVLGSGIESGFDDTELKMAGTLVLPLAAAYINSNDETPGGVPDAK
jgi:hypothetical protein